LLTDSVFSAAATSIPGWGGAHDLIQEIYGMHNAPTLPIGHFATRKGPCQAASDSFTIRVEGKGSHAATPHKGIDPLVVGANILLALQAIVARNLDPLKAGIVTVGTFHAGNAPNVIPQTAVLEGTVRSLETAVRDLLERRLRETAAGIAAAYGATARVDYVRTCPVTVNHARETEFAVQVARDVVGTDKVIPKCRLSWARRISPSCWRRVPAL
jgi:hippurate hydrolase